MRIGMFNGDLPQPGRKNGGVDYFVHRLANHLVLGGHQVVMFSHAVRAPEDARYALRNPHALRPITGQLTRLTIGSIALNGIDARDLDVLHLHGDDWFYLRRTVPTVRTFYGSALREARSATSRKRRVVQSCVYPAEVLASRLATASYRCGPDMPAGYRIAGTLPLAVDLPLAADIAHASRSSRPSVLFVGTWEGRKRGRELRDAFVRRVLPTYPDAELVMVSDRCEESPGVRWLRFPTDEALAAAYGAAWVFCLPSSYEGFGIPYIEAMAHGTPVVATPNPGSLMVSENGRYARIGEIDELGTMLVELLADPGERRRLAEIGVARAQDFSWEASCARHVGAYETAISAFRPRGRLHLRARTGGGRGLMASKD